MFKQFLKGMDGMDQYLIFSMIVFIIFFLGVCVYLWKMNKEKVEEMKQIPLNDSKD